MKIYVSAFLYLALLIIHVLPARAEQYYYKQICLEEGLPPTVNCILRDKYGAVWIGTRKGLGRYDDNGLKMYKNDEGNLHSLPGNTVRYIVEDKQQNIWILTNKGIVRYRRQYDDFERIVTEDGKNGVTYSACPTDDGILFAGSNILYFYNYKDSLLSVKHTLDHGFVATGLFRWNDHAVLCYSRWTGIQITDLRNGKDYAPPFDCGKDIRALYIDSQERIWVSPFNKGIRCYDRDGKLLASYTTENSALSNDVVLSIAERNGNVWIGTDGGGINILHPETGRFTLLTHLPGREKQSLPSNSILYLYNDAYNNMWAGSVRGGLISIREVSVKAYTETFSNNDDGLSCKEILCLYQESDDRIWIGTEGGGINLFHPHTGKFTFYPETANEKVTAICPFTNGKLLIFVYSKGRYVFDPATGKKYSFDIDIAKDQAYNNRYRRGSILNLYRNTPDNILFLGTDIYSHDLRNRSTVLVKRPEEIAPLISPTVITQQGDNVYLFDPKHIIVYDSHSRQLSRLFSCSPDTVLNSVSRDDSGRFWIGSNRGLMRYDATSKELKSYPATQSTEISLVMCDHKNNVWLGANNSLYVWLDEERRLVRFGETDGVIPNEYQPKAFLQDRNGDIYLGGVMGLLHIDSNISLAKSDIPQLQLTDVAVDGKRLNISLNEIEGAKVSVPWNSHINVRVTSMEEDFFRQKIYRYRIEGFNEQYIESSSSELVISSLPHGTYHITASCMTKYGKWTPDYPMLQLIILPPWYLSWWFILLGIVLAIGTAAYAIHRLMKRKDEKLKWAMKEHEQQVYEEKVRFLINISHELRTPLTLICAPLSRLLKRLPLEEENYHSLNGIYKQAQRMKNLINMVLDVRKMEVGENKLSIHPHPLNEWVEQVTANFADEGKAMKVIIRSHLSPEVGTVNFDKGKCEIVLNNLLSNALKHSTEQTSITVSTRLLAAEGKVQIAVTDEGCGLKQVNVDKLFTRFYQGAGETQGSGIGLSYAKMLIELHGGDIGAFDNASRSEDAAATQGATFFFNLPLDLSAEELVCPPKPYMNELIGENTAKETDNLEEFDTTPYTILVIDDNPDLTSFLKQELANSFKRVLTASDGEEGLLLIKSHTPDIVVSDVMMPRMNGYELCKNIKEDIDISHIPVVLLTARDDTQSRINGYKNAADAYLTKPFEVEMLTALITSRLKNREAIKKRYQQLGTMPNLEENTTSAADEKFLFKLNQIIQDNLSESTLDISFICQEIGMSRTVLFTKLKAITGMGANDYINKLRMDRAILLVLSTELSITEIAEQTGFSTPRYFSTVFKQHTGMTPTQYKKEHKQAQA